MHAAAIDAGLHLHGHCHCGDLRFFLDWPGAQATLPGRACSCTFCTRHGAVWVAHPDARVAIEVAPHGAASRYRFGTRTAEFLVCMRCGSVVACTSRIEGRDYAVVNANMLDAPAIGLAVEPVDFEGEPDAARLARRARRWCRMAPATQVLGPPGLEPGTKGL